jgi:heterodisulfide reductase subunit A-like polyferredoxin
MGARAVDPRLREEVESFVRQALKRANQAEPSEAVVARVAAKILANFAGVEGFGAQLSAPAGPPGSVTR